MIIDVSAGVGQWAFDPLRRVDASELAAVMKEEGVYAALASPVECICYKNPHLILMEHFERLEPYPSLIPVPVINPLLGDSLKNVEKSAGLGAPAVKLYPNYHGYEPGCPQADSLLEFCKKAGLAVMFQIRVEDVRRQHRVMNVPDVEIDSVLDVIERHPGLPVIICGQGTIKSPERRMRIINRPRTYVDTSFTEYLDTLNTPSCTLDGSYERVMMGTHTPFFYIRANILKLEAIKNKVKAYEQVAFRNALNALNLKEYLDYHMF